MLGNLSTIKDENDRAQAGTRCATIFVAMKRFYFPLVMTIVVGELAVLVWLLANVIPLHPGELYLQEDAAYRPYISSQDVSSPASVIAQWLFFLLIAGTLIPVGLIILGELVRWGLDQRKRGRLGV